MFASLSSKLTGIFDKIRGRGLLKEEDIDAALKMLRLALIEADVSLKVVKKCFESVKEKAKVQSVIKSLQPEQLIIKILYDELVEMLGNPKELIKAPKSSYMMVGLQGAGKTTTTAKLANLLKSKFKVTLCSLDVYRPAAREQLEVLGKSLGVSVFKSSSNDPIQIAKEALLNNLETDITIFDTAGRLHIDDKLMNEVVELKKLINPVETILVLDSLMGQDAINVCGAFNEKVGLSSVILTRLDGDARGGAALSMSLTGIQISHIGVGEKTNQLQVFDPKRLASQILDMGDVVGLVEAAMQSIDDPKDLEVKIKKGKFNLEDMKSQLDKMQKMGGIVSFLKFIPGMAKFKDAIEGKGDKEVLKQLALINSMTPLERRNPDILQASRKRRIAKGAGQDVASLNRLLKQFEQMKSMMKHFSNEKNIKRGGLSKLFGIQ